VPEQHPDILLLDLNMPVMNGWDFLEEFRARGLTSVYGKLKIYILTSSIYKSDIEAAKQHDLVSDYLTKPLDENCLATIIRE
jgi:CheY-like chemotaxis protein